MANDFKNRVLETLATIETSTILESLPEDRTLPRNLDDTPYWKREVFPVLRRLKPYRLRRRPTAIRDRQPWFEISGHAPEGYVRLHIAILDPMEHEDFEIDSDMARLLQAKGYLRNGYIFWRCVPITELEPEIDELFSSREDWRLLHNSTQARRIDLAVPYSQKDEAKALGAGWDAEKRTWWVSELDHCREIDKRGW